VEKTDPFLFWSLVGFALILVLAICGTAVVIRRSLRKQPLGPLAWAVGIFWPLIVALAEHLFG
jgi:uncharacterized oligopeptide transporter (OPT) family protein